MTTHSDDRPDRVLYLVICGAGPADKIEAMIGLARQRGWDVRCIATPAAVRHFLDLDAIHLLTGHRPRTDHQRADQPRLPHADAVIVAPATYNTINKWALGIADNYVLTQLAELTGLDVPIAVLPFVNTAYTAHPAFATSIATLRRLGVTVLHGPGILEPHPPRTGGALLDTFPWHLALDTVETVGHDRRASRHA